MGDSFSQYESTEGIRRDCRLRIVIIFQLIDSISWKLIDTKGKNEGGEMVQKQCIKMVERMASFVDQHFIRSGVEPNSVFGKAKMIGFCRIIISYKYFLKKTFVFFKKYAK